MIIALYEGKIAGSIVVQRMSDSTTGEFGMLVTDPEKRGKRLGSALVEAAEAWAKTEKFQTMRLELLTPRTWSHPSKEFASAWYTRLRYVPQKTEAFEDMYPHLADKLATECNFTVWLKSLK